MIKGKWKLLICMMFIACTIFVTSNSLFAAINQDYYDSFVKEYGVQDASINKKLEQSLLTDAIGSFIYGIASLMELAVGWVFKLLTGSNIFPWADAILFNAIPFLDVNVFTASDGSLVGLIRDFIANTYYTVLTLATTFFGIAIMVSAIKLAITAIAEDKAKYKKAIVDWLLGLVMLYGIHFGMSFLLYLNEQLVIAASDIAKKKLNDASDITIVEYDSETALRIVNNFLDSTNGLGVANIAGVAIGGLLMGGTGSIIGMYASVLFNELVAVGSATQAFSDYYIGVLDGSVEPFTMETSETYLKEHAIEFANLLANDEFVKALTGDPAWYKPDVNTGGDGRWLKSPTTRVLGAHALREYLENDEQYFLDKLEAYGCNDHSSSWEDEKTISCNYLELGRSYTMGNVVDPDTGVVTRSKSELNVISNLASFFKDTVWVSTEKSWTPNTISIPGAIMYAILVAQSLIFFIAYVKRLFFVIVLVVMAPVVVVYEFFTKFGSISFKRWCSYNLD